MPTSSAKRKAQDLVLPYAKHPRIELSHQSAIHAECGNDEAPISAITTDEICHDCQKIDFEAIFGEDRQCRFLYKIWGNRRITLSHMNPQRNCTLCQFFHNTIEPPLNNTAVDPSYSLRVFPAKGELGAWQLSFDNSPAFKVVSDQDIYRNNFQDTNGIIMELSDAPKMLCGYQIQPQIDLSVVKGWLEFCENNHKALCKQISDPQMPEGFCVIDCLTRKIVPWEIVAHTRHYVTLSYVWGDSENCATQMRGIPSPLPATIEDTFLLTKRLGYRYLWVDRYCIPQDNDVDKQKQIQNMHQIYQHSVLTVVAAAGDNPHFGLPGIGATPRKRQPCVKVGNKTLVFCPYARKEILNSKWNSRGWTYQEGLLARRKLIFTASQTYFQCHGMHCLESILAPLEELHIHKNIRMRDMVEISRVFPVRGLGKNLDDLNNRLNEYLKRSLKFEIDILDAFRGVLAAFENKFGRRIRSLCGIPLFIPDLLGSELDALVLGLSWSTIAHGQEPKRRTGFPSWTWAGWKIPEISFHITFPSRLKPAFQDKAIVSISMEYADGLVLPWSEARDLVLDQDKSGSTPLFLHICGPTFDVQILTDGTILGDDEGGIAEQIRTRHYGNSFGEMVVRNTREAYQMEQHKDDSFQFTLLILSHSTFDINILLLFQPEGSLNFERITRLYVEKKPLPGDSGVTLSIPEALKGWTTRTVKIG